MMTRKVVPLAALFALMLCAAPTQTFADTSINQLFGQLEQQYALPAASLAKIALVESGGNPNAGSSSSSAVGLFQWLSGSWEAASRALYGRPLDPSSRTSPIESAKVTAFALAEAKSQIGSLITQAQVDMTVGLYLSHFLGIGGARVFLSAYIQSPGQSACSLFPKECRANGSVLNRSLSGVINYFAQKLSQPGVVNIAGNFQDQNGVSYAYSSGDLSPQNFLPANTQIVPDPQYDYPTTYTSGTQSQSATSPSLQQSNTLPQQYTTPTITPSQPILGLPTLSTSTSALSFFPIGTSVSIPSATTSTSTATLLEELAYPTSATTTPIGTATSISLGAGTSDTGTAQSGDGALTQVGATSSYTSYPGAANNSSAGQQETFTSSDMGGSFSSTQGTSLSPLAQILADMQAILESIVSFLSPARNTAS